VEVGQTYRLVPVEPLLEGEVERRKRALATKREQVREAMQRLENHQQSLGALEEKLRQIMLAVGTLKGVKVGNGDDKAEKLREQLEVAKRNKALWDQRREAADLQLRVEAHQAVIDLLGPKGMRRTVLLDALAKFERDSLDPLVKGTGTWKPITIDRDTLLPLFGGRPYGLLSRSEQYRTDITLQIAIALLEGAAMVCIDGADVLSHNGQDDLLLGLLDKLPFPVFIGATYSRPKDCPNLDQANIGHSYWISAGKLVPRAEALA
jgi:predicted metal-dependent hydrolase